MSHSMFQSTLQRRSTVGAVEGRESSISVFDSLLGGLLGGEIGRLI